jgi:hypothetical protein
MASSAAYFLKVVTGRRRRLVRQWETSPTPALALPGARRPIDYYSSGKPIIARVSSPTHSRAGLVVVLRCNGLERFPPSSSG